MSDRFDLRAGYGRIELSDPGDDGGINVVGAGPKVYLTDQSALFVPVGFAFGQDIEVSDTVKIHPTVLFTTVLGERFER